MLEDKAESKEIMNENAWMEPVSRFLDWSKSKISRREFLRGTVASVTGVLLTACSGNLPPSPVETPLSPQEKKQGKKKIKVYQGVVETDGNIRYSPKLTDENGHIMRTNLAYENEKVRFTNPRVVVGESTSDTRSFDYWLEAYDSKNKNAVYVNATGLTNIFLNENNFVDCIVTEADIKRAIKNRTNPECTTNTGKRVVFGLFWRNK